jgi:hypothetical protein
MPKIKWRDLPRIFFDASSGEARLSYQISCKIKLTVTAPD